MSGFGQIKGHSHVRFHRAAQNFAGIRRNSAGNVAGNHRLSAGIDFFNQRLILPRNRPGQSGAKQRIDNHVSVLQCCKLTAVAEYTALLLKKRLHLPAILGHFLPGANHIAIRPESVRQQEFRRRNAIAAVVPAAAENHRSTAGGQLLFHFIRQTTGRPKHQ